MSTRSTVREDGTARGGEYVFTRASGDCEEAAILEPLRRRIQIRMAEGADDEDILREVWKWWNGDSGPGAWGGRPVESR